MFKPIFSFSFFAAMPLFTLSSQFMDLPRTIALLDSSYHLHPGWQLSIRLGDLACIDLADGSASDSIPLTIDSLMLWMSCSKPISSIALAICLERDGSLSLDDPVCRFIPDFFSHGKESITLRHILTHTAGLRTADLVSTSLPWGEMLESLYNVRPEPRSVPGEKAAYHSLGTWTILGECITRITGQPLSQFLREQLFQLLGMDDCFLGIPEQYQAAYQQRIAWMFDTTKDPAQPIDKYNNPQAVALPVPGSHGRGPARQLANFWQMLLNRGTWNGKAILKEETVALFTGRVREGMHDHTFKQTMDWGMGFVMNSSHYGSNPVPYGFGEHASRDTFGHGGSQSSQCLADPEHELVIVLITNGMPGEAAHQQRTHNVLTTIYEELGLG